MWWHPAWGEGRFRVNAAHEQGAAVRALAAAEPAPAGGGSDAVAGWLQQLCAAAVRAVPACGAGVSVMTDEGVGAVAAASDPVSRSVGELEFTLGEGPGLDAFSSRRPVLEPDLGRAAAWRWPGYAPGAGAVGVRAVFALPLQVGAARIGVLDLYLREPGSLQPQALALALTFAEVAVEGLLDGQARSGQGRMPAGLDRAFDSHAVVYQAQGMVMIDLEVSLGDAMARLRGYAFALDRPLQLVAADVVSGLLRLERDRR
jgi:hypothetical protein